MKKNPKYRTLKLHIQHNDKTKEAEKTDLIPNNLIGFWIISTNFLAKTVKLIRSFL